MFSSDLEYGDPTVDHVVGDGEWYDTDLQLAAELGKTLLERNRDLEGQLRHSQQIQYEQAKEIDLLVKQLDVLRNVNDSRMRIYEEVDRNLQELEKTNEKFRHEIRSDKDKIKRLTQTVDSLEVKCAELNTKLEELQATERQRKKNERSSRTWSSVPSLVESSDCKKEQFGNYEYPGFGKFKTSPVETEHVKKLKDTLRDVRVELVKEQRRREAVEAELGRVVKANEDLSGKVERFEQDQEEIALSEQESFTPDLRMSQLICRGCSKSGASETSSIADPELLEHDIDEVPRGQVVRLKCGGSAYGSRESLHMIGLEADDVTMESGSDILVSGHVINWKMDEPGDEIKSPDAKVSLLGELEVQYRKLVHKYERLIEAKEERAAAKEAATQDNLDEAAVVSHHGVKMRQKKDSSGGREAQASWRNSLSLDLRSPGVDPIQGHFENGPPEYKRLFKEIFDTLQRSATYEDEMIGQKSASVSPEDLNAGLGETSG